jgi:hypothetical protein
MFDVNLIKQELTGLVGFRQPANPKFAILDDANQESKSGLYVTDNPYAKIEFFKASVDYERATNIQLNLILKRMLETSAVSVCNQVYDADDFVDRNQLYEATQNKTQELNLPIGFIGYRIDIVEGKNIAIRLNRAIFELVQPGTLDLLIFNSNIKQPVKTIPIEYSEFYHAETIDVMLNNVGYYKGSFFVGFVNDGSISTYKKNYLSSSAKNKIKHLDITNQVVDGYTGAELFDLNQSKEFAEYCGFNLDITVVDDFTDFITTNKYLFARAIYLDVIVAFLNTYASSLRSNGDERTAAELYSKIMVEIEGTRPDDNVISVRGLRSQLIYEISQIRDQIFKLKEGFFGKGYFVDTQD